MEYKTSRLHIRPLDLQDADDVTALLTDGQVGKTYMLPEFHSREEALPLFHRLVALSRDTARYVAGIYYEDHFIGILNETDKENYDIEVGYALLPAYHNRGFATEALVGAIEYLRGCGFSRILAGAFSENAASLRVMEKAGMVRIDKTDAIDYRGHVHTCIYYASCHS